MVIGSFAVITVMARDGDTGNSLADYRGLARRQPYLAGSLAILLLAQAGIPPTTGFWAKLQVVAASVDVHSYALAVVAMLSAAVAGFFYLRVVVTMYSPTGAVADLEPGATSSGDGDTEDVPVSGTVGDELSIATVTEAAPRNDVVDRVVAVPFATRVALGLCVGFTVVFGIFPEPVISFAHQATLLFVS
jgi:NADH-quinone oxidoreductase subunit N